ncbi:hypothetical protein [Streptomyces sp. NPDC059802]|uniref:hypothetical protein n=1 Tax=Streptomyces sp. NPDC059802 TaxID=3346952 RepID=UPI003662191E
MSSTLSRAGFAAVAGMVCAVMLALPSPAQAHAPQAAPASNRTQVQAADDHAATLAALKTFQANAGPGRQRPCR